MTSVPTSVGDNLKMPLSKKKKKSREGNSGGGIEGKNLGAGRKKWFCLKEIPFCSQMSYLYSFS